MSKVGKKHQAACERVKKASISSWREGFELIVNAAHASFDESVDVDIILGIDPAKGEQAVRGSALLPHGTGKKLRVLVFAKGEYVDQARTAGADFVGDVDLIEKIEKGWLDFDVAVATPDMMGLVGKVAKILGPRSLLPNKKVGTVTFEVADIIEDLKRGRISFKNDKGGCLHISFGKVSFGIEKLLENFSDLMKSVVASKPAASKGTFIKKVTVSSTMGPGVSLSPDGTP